MVSQNLLLPSAPEAQGIASDAVLQFVEEVEKNIHELHSFVLLRHGQLVAEGWWAPYGREYPHMLFSLSKSFTSTAVGMAVSEGCLSVEDLVLSFFPEDAPQEVDENLAAMRVKHLLTMSTGHEEDTTGRIRDHEDENWVKAFLALPVEHQPGTHFVYNSGASYMLSAIVQKVTGMKVLDYLQPRLFEPLGIKNATWETSPQGINMGGWGLSIKTEDIARFGQMYLQKGIWNGKRVLPEAWVNQATARQVSNGSKPDSDWEQGYGYQFWRCQHGAYRGDGAFGQYCIVMPEQDAVLAINSGVGDMQAVLNVVWEQLLPAMGPDPLPVNPKASEALNQKLKNLSIQPAQDPGISPNDSKRSGRRITFEENLLQIEAVSFDFESKACVVKVTQTGQEEEFNCGREEWIKGTTSIFSFGRTPQAVAASFTWTTEDTLVLTLRFYETPFYNTLTCCFQDDQVSIDTEVNVAFGKQVYPRLVGKLS